MRTTAIERARVNLPPGFDQRHHEDRFLRMVADQLGEGFEIDSIDMAAGVAHVSRQSAITEVLDNREIIEIGLRRGVKPADGDKIQKQYEDANPGYTLVEFEPFLGLARLRKLAGHERNCRDHVAAEFGVKPWEVQVTSRRDGGYDLKLTPRCFKGKYAEKLEKVATENVGAVGWFVRTEPGKLRASLIPSEPPTFPAVIPAPLNRIGTIDYNLIPVGMDLPEPGEAAGREFTINFGAASYVLVGGIPQSGKSVLLNAIIGFSLGAGSELVIVDTPDKAVDFLWCRDMVRRSGWGCESLQASVTALALVYEEGQRRAAVLRRHEVVNWTQLPTHERFCPILVVVDEFAAIVGADKVPAGIPKTHPLVQEALQTNLLKAQIDRWVSKITAEMRFVGIRMVLSSQVTNANTGLPPSLKAKLGHRMLQGANPSKSARAQAFNDPDAVPVVPENVRADEKAARGVGGYESEGRFPSVFKSYFATTDDYRRALVKAGVPLTDHGEPTAQEIATHTPSLDDDGSDIRVPSSLDGGGWGAPDGRDAPAPRLRGAAAAAHDLRVEAGQAARRRAADGDGSGVEEA